MKIIQLLLPIFLLLTRVGFSQWIVYTPYNTKGIEGTMVSSGFVAGDDKLWFGTDKGAACFDPEYSVWTNYNTSNSLKNNFIYQVFEDQEGNIWVATNGGGVSRYSNLEWTNYTVHDGLSYDVVRAISQSPDGRIWFGTYGHGICSYNAETGFKKYSSEAIANSYVLSLLALSDDQILIGTLNEGLIVLENDTVKSLQNGNDLSGKKVFSIFRDHSDKIWIGTDQGVQQYDPSKRMVASCPDSLKGKPVYAICENQSHELVFTSNNKIYTLSDGSWSTFIPDNLSNSTSFYSAFYDKEGNGWFGSSNQGLFKKTGPSWYNYFDCTGLNTTYLNGMCEDKSHNLWFTSYSGIYRFDGQNWSNFTQNTALNNSYFGQILTDLNGNVWCTAYSQGLFKYDGSKWTNYSLAVYFTSSYIINLILAPDGAIWAGTYSDGIFRFDGNNWTHFTTNEGMASNNIKAMAFYPDDKMAVVSEYGQISFYNGNTWTFDNTLVGKYYISDMAIDLENNIWLSTSNGIVRYKDSATQTYFEDNNYGYSYVSFITADKSGLIWAGLNNTGLLLYDGASWYTFSTTNGLSSNYPSDILFDSRGRTWVLAENGINMSADLTGINEHGTLPLEKIVAYPNPFSESFYIQYSSNQAGFADIHIFGADGRLLKQYNQQKVDMGVNTFHFESDNWPDGILFCKIMMAGSSENMKMIKVFSH
jgi:ligand-binding sensor domain-containing protein